MRFGLHVHEQADLDSIRALARAGLLSSITVINNAAFANEMAGVVPYVIFRQVWSVSDPQPNIRGDSGDERRGMDWYNDSRFWASKQTDRRVILQFANEQNMGHIDNKFYLGLMKAADADGRKVVIFNDPVGSDDHYSFDLAKGRFTSPSWNARKEARQYALDHGHCVGMHVYGAIDANFHPVSAFDDEGAWWWYAGRVFGFYMSDPDCQPPLILTEIGPGKAEWQQKSGYSALWKDIMAFEARIKAYPFLKAYNWWTAGACSPMWGFEGACIDAWFPQLTADLKAEAKKA
jgi:hypothetical protein